MLPRRTLWRDDKDIAIAYGVFLAAALFAGFATTDGSEPLRPTLADLLGGDLSLAATGGESGQGIFLILLATATVIVPYLVTWKYAPLAWLMPVFVTMSGFWPLHEQALAQQEAISALSEFGVDSSAVAAQLDGGIGHVFGFWIGAYLSLAAGIYLAYRCYVRMRSPAGTDAISSSAS